MQSDRPPPSPERDLRALYEGAPVEIGSVERTFAARLYDPATGSTRDIVIEISSALVAVRLTEPRRRGEDGPHHVCADFTDQREELAEALVTTRETDERTDRP